MITRRMIVVLFLLLGMVPAIGQETEKPPAAKPGEPAVQSDANAIVRFSADTATGLANRALLETMMTPALIERALEKFAKETDAKDAGPKKPANEIIQILPAAPVNLAIGSEPPGICTFVIHAASYDKYVNAAKFIEVWANALSTDLRDLDEMRNGPERLHKLLDRRDGMSAEIEREHKTLQALAKIHNSEMTPELQIERGSRSREALETAQVQLQGLTARQAVIQKHLATVLASAAEAKSDDPVLKRLEQIVSIQNDAFQKFASQKPGSGRERADAEEKLARAEAELAQYKRDVLDAGGGRRANELRARLETNLEELAECEARVKALTDIHRGANSSAQVEMKRLSLDSMKRQYQQLSEEIVAEQSKILGYQFPRATVQVLTQSGK